MLTSSIERPNGIGFSPDEEILYVAQSNPKKPNWTAYPVKEDGTLGEGREFYNAMKQLEKNEPGLPDGLVVDEKGNVWATGPGGVFVFRSDGTLLGRLTTNERTSNCEIAEDGWLYITADSYLCRVKTNAKPIAKRGG